MKAEEIYFLRKIGFPIKDDKEIITTACVNEFLTIPTLVDELNIISSKNFSRYKEIMKHTVYASCMMHYTIDAWNRKYITKKIFNNVMDKAVKILKKAPKFAVILTMMYEGPHYLHPKILAQYEKAGYKKATGLYLDIFGKIVSKEARARTHSKTFNNEKEAYLALYDEFIKKDISKWKWS